MTYQIHQVKPESREDAERLADLFNDMDDAWPGGFSRGLAFTAEKMQDMAKRMRREAMLVVTHEDEFVGYCDMEAQAGQKEQLYISLLGARLSHHGKGVGKMLLQEMVRRASIAGFRQLTLYTWAGNTKAVPLYKKTGFHWVPETQVFMRNYVPAILSSPAGNAFFQQRDWYACQVRDLTVAPDDIKLEGMKVYPYRFQEGDDFLNITFDAQGHGITAIETPRYSVRCIIPVEEAAAGDIAPIRWHVETRSEKPVELILLIESEDGLILQGMERLTVHEQVTIEKEIAIAPNAAPLPGDRRARRVRSTLILDGDPILLETGVKVVRPVEILYGGQALIPGQATKIVVGLKSNLDRPVEGRLSLEIPPGLECMDPSQPYSIQPKLRSECSYSVTARGEGDIISRLRLSAGTSRVEREVHFHALSGPNAVGGIEEEYGEQAVLENMSLRLESSLRGGWMRVVDASSGEEQAGVGMPEAGPPYIEEPTISPYCSARIDSRADGKVLVQQYTPPEFPGLRVERYAQLLGDGLIRLDCHLFNESDQVQESQLALSINPGWKGSLVLPLIDGVVKHEFNIGSEFPMGETDPLGYGEQLTETWTASEWNGRVAGIVWNPEIEHFYHWGPFPTLRGGGGSIPPDSVYSLPTVYLVTGAGDWRKVRKAWQRLISPCETFGEPEPKAIPMLEVNLEPSPALITQEYTDVRIVMHNRRGRPEKGRITLVSKQFQLDPASLEVENVDRDNPFFAEVRIHSSNIFDIEQGEIVYDSGGMAHRFPLPLIRISGEGAAEVSERTDMMAVSNGKLTFIVSPRLGGSITALEIDGVNQLHSAWPEARAFRWINPWIGGVHPYLGGWNGDSRLVKEKIAAEHVERTGDRGNHWKGVKLTCSPEHKDLHHLLLEVEYLTLPQSSLIAIVRRITNRSGARVREDGGLAVWAQPGGARDNTTQIWPYGGKMRERKREEFPSELISDLPWAAAENPDTGDTLVLSASGSHAKLEISGWDCDGVQLMANAPSYLMPGETHEQLFWLFHLADRSAIEACSAMSAIDKLP